MGKVTRPNTPNITIIMDITVDKTGLSINFLNIINMDYTDVV